MSSSCRDQRGATLVLALVVVMVVVALATRISRDYFVLQRTLENQAAQQQARAWLRGAETVAQSALLEDLQNGSATDSALEMWAQRLELPLPDGVLHACLLDLQSRLNLNDLAAPQSEGLSAAQKRFIRLLQVLPLETPPDALTAATLANAVFDWVDVDDQQRGNGGAEAQAYVAAGHDWRPANQPFAEVGELALVLGITPELYAALTPFVSVWGNGALNLNTLDSTLLWSAQSSIGSDDVAVPRLLRTLNNADSLLPLGEQAATQLAAARSRAGGVLPSLQLFREAPWSLQQWELDGVGTSSDFFQMTADMQTATQHQRLLSVLERTRDAGGRPLVLVRSRTFVAAAFNGEPDCAAPLR